MTKQHLKPQYYPSGCYGYSMHMEPPPANSMEDSIKQSFNCNENCLRSSQLLSFASFGELFILHNRDWDSNWGRPFLHSAAPSRLCKKAVLIIKIFTFSVGNIRKNSITIVSLSQSLGAGEYEANEDHKLIQFIRCRYTHRYDLSCK